MSRSPPHLADTDLAALFGPGGPLAAHLPGYEPRPSQHRMAEAVKEALLSRTHALIEAPTGTGKSLAYLVPALLTGETVIVATANKSLQHQLYSKDIPLASRVLGRPIDAVLVKGRSNFVCNWKWDRELREQGFLADLAPDREQVDALRAWLGRTDSGDVDDLPFVLAGDLRQRVVSFPDDCLYQDCEHYADNCFVNFMRDRAAEAEVLITNHHLLLTALQLEDAGARILPGAPIYVIDEAHHLPDTATAVFEAEVTDHALMALLARKVYQDHVGGDVLDELRFENRLAFDEIARMGGDPAGRAAAPFRLTGDIPRLRALAKRLRQVAEQLERENPYRSRRPDDFERLWLDDPPPEADPSMAGAPGAAAGGSAWAVGSATGDGGNPADGPTPADALITADGSTPADMPASRAHAVARVAAPDPMKARAKLYELAVSSLGSLADKYQAVASSRRDGVVVRYAEPVLGRRQVRLALHAAPIQPAGLLHDFLFGPPKRSVVCTSATLSAGAGFAHFKARCGVEAKGPELVAPPVFDYPNQALLYQPAMPAYSWADRSGFYRAVAEEIRRLLEVSRGRALCLFTSWSGLQQAQGHLATAAGSIWPLRAQGDAPREALLDWFRATPHSVLLATRSFWEGVDIPGDDLSLVVLDKLPFPTPSDPLHKARMDAVEAEGGSSFDGYMLPLMTLALKQGFGRLIRRATDRGVVAILDDRLTSKGYGRAVRQDLPPARFTRQFADVHGFYGEALGGAADFALSVRAEAADDGGRAEREGLDPIFRWRWQLCRLRDGKADGDEGLTMDLAGAAACEAHAALLGLANLRERIERAGRRPADFQVELRCDPETALALGTARPKAAALPRELRDAWKAARKAWGGVAVLAVGTGR